MPTDTQNDNLRRLQQELARRPDVGPIEPPALGPRYVCHSHRPYWLVDTTTLELAANLAARREPRCRPRFRLMGLSFGRPRIDPLADYYGLTPEQIRRIEEIDFEPTPDPREDGRTIWLRRQLHHLDHIIAHGRPYVTFRDPLLHLDVIQSTEETIDASPEPAQAATPGR